MDTPTSAAPDEKNASAELALATQLRQIGNAREVETLWPAGDQRRTKSTLPSLG